MSIFHNCIVPLWFFCFRLFGVYVLNGLCFELVSFCLPSYSGAQPVALTRSVIEAHQVKSVEAYGRYAIVKLPINKGVALWNPVAITQNAAGVIYVANYVGEVYSLHDTNGDGLEDEARLFCNVTDDKLRYPTSILFNGNKGPGKGKHIVFVTGDEEYRSEECMPMLAALLSKRYGFKCTVLFAINKQTGDIDPNVISNIPGLEALATADLMFVYTRFRDLPDE